MIPSCGVILYNPYFQQIANMSGIISVWWIYDVLYSSYSVALLGGLHVSKYSFFIYLVHEPALNIIKKMGMFILGVNDMTLVVLYIISPILMTAITIGAAIMIKAVMPRFYSIAVGGR